MASDCVWRLLEPTPEAARLLAAELGLPLLMAQVLCHRGYSDPGEAHDFLNPSHAQLPRPEGLKGLDRALDLLVPAVQQGLTLGVAGDYDADGVTATALMVDFLRQVGARVVWDLPHRLQEGYGFSPAGARRLAQAGAQVVITVDCGISDHQGLEQAHELGLAVVVTDHHQIPPGPLVAADALVNPQQPGCGFSPHLAGVGLAFYLAAALRAGLRQVGHFAQRPEPNLMGFLDLVALGTCADVVPLVEMNRVLVSLGLKVLGEARRPGLKALMQVAGLRPPLDTRDLGFGLAPRINAAGRLDHPGPALELLLSSDPGQALSLAQRLDRLNQQRRQVEQRIIDQALDQLEQDPALAQAALITLAHPEWHRGVLGIVASRLVELTGRPVMLLALEDGQAVGSGRSLPGFHLQRALAGLEHLLTRYGGHAMAAGATLPAEALPELAQGLEQAARQSAGQIKAAASLTLEAQARLSDLGPQLIEPLRRLAPFGQDNPEPMLGLRGVTLSGLRPVGGRHLKLELAQEGSRAQAIAFNWSGAAPQPGSEVDLAVTARISTYHGEHLELVVADLKPAGYC